MRRLIAASALLAITACGGGGQDNTQLVADRTTLLNEARSCDDLRTVRALAVAAIDPDGNRADAYVFATLADNAVAIMESNGCVTGREGVQNIRPAE